jgi:hypothetical protein
MGFLGNKIPRFCIDRRSYKTEYTSSGNQIGNWGTYLCKNRRSWKIESTSFSKKTPRPNDPATKLHATK